MYIFKKSRHVHRALLGSLLLMFSLYSCNEIIEDDITGKTVSIVTPADGLSSSTNQIVFWWNELEGANWYHLQIVKPSFSNVQSIVADTNVSGENFTCFLSYGNYQWRIRPENSAYTGDYVVRSFTVESDSDLTSQYVPLVLPLQNDTLNTSLQHFSWQSLPYSDSYTFTIWQNSYGGTTEYTTSVTSTNADYTFLTDGSFEWGVKAVNAISESDYNTRKIFIDTQIPSTPVLNMPTDSDTLSAGSVSFSWTHASGGSLVKDSVLIATDNTFDTVVFSSFTTNQSAIFTLPAGTYFWKVKSIDAAGNVSPWAAYRRLTID